MQIRLFARECDPQRSLCRRRRSRWRTSAAALSILVPLSVPISAIADPLTPHRTTYGEVGMLEMPTARMAPDGQLSLTFTELDNIQRISFAFQILPWLEGSFRYSHVPGFVGRSDYYDRSFGLKFRLSRETEDWPEISLGLRDVLGTGIYSGEYLVASKQFGDFDTTFGAGWGRFAQSGLLPNPLAEIFPSFRTRSSASAFGGTLNFGQLFHGPDLGLFGGGVWHTPLEGLDVIAEYSSDRYIEERSFGSFPVRSPVNLGVSYRPYDPITISAGWYYGSTYGLTLSLSADPTTSPTQRLGPEIPAPVIRPAESQTAALAQILQATRPRGDTANSAAWIIVPRIDPTNDTRALASALMTERTGVLDVDIEGRTLMVDARLTRMPDRQCEGYAAIAANIAPRLQTIALSDLRDPNGVVAICQVRRIADANDSAPMPEAPDPDAALQKIRRDVAAQNLSIEALQLSQGAVWLYYSNGQYLSESEAAGRIARVLMADAPGDVEIFHIISIYQAMPMRDFRITRGALERATLAYGTTRELGDAVAEILPPMENPALDQAFSASYPRFHWSIAPAARTGFFDPAQPLEIGVYAALDARVDLFPGFAAEGRAEATIFDNFDFKTKSDSVLPHVRTDVLKYLDQGANGIANLDAVYRARVLPDVYVEAKAGYLESMFAGAGAQIIWRPDGQRFAIGADLYHVWQRDFDRLFGVQDYNVTTGHISLYYNSPWYDIDFAVHAGRYLAGDYGATIEVTRHFASGVEIGAFATFTDVPFSEFGEGSFDKGIIVRIPFEWALPIYSKSSYEVFLRSLTRDGGARLDNDDSLYEETRPTSYGELSEHLDEITAP